MSLVKRVPFWAWIGVGCAGTIGAIVLGTAGLFFWGAQWLGDAAEVMLDPAERLEKSLEILHADELPEGYYAVLALSIFGNERAILSSNPWGEDGGPPDVGERNFFFFANFDDDAEEWHNFLEDSDTGNMTSVDIADLVFYIADVDLGERVANGVLDRDDDRITWVSHNGTVDHETLGWESDDGLVTLMLFECGVDGPESWAGVWNGPAPADVEYTGSVADPAEIESFVAPMHPCR
jgi:hypothetical protein